MSGIVGIWNLDGRPVDEPLVTGLSAALAHRGPDGHGTWLHGSVALAFHLLRVGPEASTEARPLVAPSGVALVFDGRLDNRQELLGALPAAAGLSAALPDPVLVLAAYAAFDERFVERLVGDFALGLFDPARQTLLLARDAIGVRPLYYSRVGETFLFASEIKALLAHPQRPARPRDDVLVDYIVNSARSVAGLTCFDEVFSLPPAHLAIVTARGLRLHRYWDFDPSRRVQLGSFPEYVEGFREHFERAVRRRLRSESPVAVSVSGGLDSSAILCLAETFRRRGPEGSAPVLGLTYSAADGSPSDEQAFVLEIERQHGSLIEQVPVRSAGSMSGWRSAVWHTEVPFLDGQWETTEALLRCARARGARVLLTGHWGDQVLSDQAYLIDLVRRLAWRTVRRHLREAPCWSTDVSAHALSNLFWRDLAKFHAPGWLIRGVRTLRARRQGGRWLTRAFRGLARRRAWGPPGAPPGFATANMRSLYETVRSSYHVQCLEWNNKAAAAHGLEMAFPFLDRDLLSFLMAIPGETRTWQGVPRALLRESLRGVLPDAIRGRTSKGDYTHRVNDRLWHEYPQLLQCLGASGLAVQRGYLEAATTRGLSGLRRKLRGPTCADAWTLLDLLGLELWLQTFVGGEIERHNEAVA